MAQNDIILLDGIIEQRVSEGLPSGKLDEAFEYLAFEQGLKDYDLSREEIESGWLDGRNDGGIDGFFIITNGHLLRDPSTFAWPKRNATIEVVIVTAKHHAAFQQAPINSLLATLPEIFDLARDNADLTASYSEALLEARSLFHLAYRRLAAISPTVTFRFVYASRGDSGQVDENIRARADQVATLITNLFSSSTAAFQFLGAAELVELYRRNKTFSLALPFLEYFSRAGDSYVVLTRLDDYHAFVSDEHGQLRRYLFDSNVRDYLGENTVNEDIGVSLREEHGPEFWWLNNGVTILATGATVLGKVIQLQDVQIVNGLQTTESIFRHFATGATDSRDRGLLVKVVVSTDPSVRDQIIRATNNQSLVEAQSLHATDKIQRDIEEILERYGWFYERRKNYYRNIGKPPARFVTPMYLAAGYVALVMRNPATAGRLRPRFMRNSEAYATVFSDTVPLAVWPVIADVLKRCEEVLETVRPHGGSGERFMARSRNLLALVAVARVLGTFDYSVHDLAKLTTSSLTADLLRDTWEFILTTRSQPGTGRKEPPAERVCIDAAKAFKLGGAERLGRQKLPSGLGKPLVLTEPFIDAVYKKLPAPPFPAGIHVQIARDLDVKAAKVNAAIHTLIARGKWTADPAQVVYNPNQPSEGFIERVDRALPPQPWKPGTHAVVAKELDANPSRVHAAIQTLIARGKWRQQIDGVVYDENGRIVGFDPERVQQKPSAGSD